MIKHRCYWCRKYATEDVLIRRDGFGFCCSECVIEFAAAVLGDGYDTKDSPAHGWLVERPVPDHLRDEFRAWFEFCEKDEPGAFPVTCLTL